MLYILPKIQTKTSSNGISRFKKATQTAVSYSASVMDSLKGTVNDDNVGNVKEKITFLSRTNRIKRKRIEMISFLEEDK